MKEIIERIFVPRIIERGIVYLMWDGEKIRENSPEHKQKVKEYMKLLEERKRKKEEELAGVKEKIPQVNFQPDGRSYQCQRQRAISEAHSEIFRKKSKHLLKEKPFK